MASVGEERNARVKYIDNERQVMLYLYHKVIHSKNVPDPESSLYIKRHNLSFSRHKTKTNRSNTIK